MLTTANLLLQGSHSKKVAEIFIRVSPVDLCLSESLAVLKQKNVRAMNRTRLPSPHVPAYFKLPRTLPHRETPKARIEEVLLMRYHHRDGERWSNLTGFLCFLTAAFNQFKITLHYLYQSNKDLFFWKLYTRSCYAKRKIPIPHSGLAVIKVLGVVLYQMPEFSISVPYWDMGRVACLCRLWCVQLLLSTCKPFMAV